MISIVFTASNTLLGKAIRWLSVGRVSHAMIQYESDTWGGDWIAEATLQGVRLVPAEKARHNVVAEYRCTFNALLALRSLRPEIGLGYDFVGLLYFGWVLLAKRWLHRKVRRMVDGPGDICSELVAKFMRYADLPESPWPAERVTPEQLLEYCEKHPELFQGARWGA
jgi:hypothetical protein